MGAEAESSAGVAAIEEVNVNIRCSNGSKFSVKASLQSTVAEFKGVLAQNCDVPAEQQRLIYKGRILKDDQTLVSYGILIPFKFIFIFFWWLIVWFEQLYGFSVCVISWFWCQLDMLIQFSEPQFMFTRVNSVN